MLFVEYPKCTACRKAQQWLDVHLCEYEDRHIREQNPTIEELKEWQSKSGLPLRRFFNTSGFLYKEMNLRDRLKEMSEEEQFALLASDGMLVKRPILVEGDKVLVGFQEAEWEKLLLKLSQRFEFRSIELKEAEQTAEIERICFPPNEACSERMMLERVAAAPEMFLVAVDKKTGLIAGFLNGLATDEGKFRDEFFTDADLHDPAGKNVLLLGLDVLPEYRGQGLAREIVARYAAREKERGRKRLILTCLPAKIMMYKKMGFQNAGISASVWGGEQWYEMGVEL